MEETQGTPPPGDSGERFIIRFRAATGFSVVLEYGNAEAMDKDRRKIEEAGLTCERIGKFTTQFDQADLYMDMRSPECQVQFDLDDWI